jgi:predicted nucleic acid-binding protein
LLELLAAHPSAGKQVHDANIVATMQVHDVHRLLTFNTGDFRRFAGIIDLEPLPAI